VEPVLGLIVFDMICRLISEWPPQIQVLLCTWLQLLGLQHTLPCSNDYLVQLFREWSPVTSFNSYAITKCGYLLPSVSTTIQYLFRECIHSILLTIYKDPLSNSTLTYSKYQDLNCGPLELWASMQSTKLCHLFTSKPNLETIVKYWSAVDQLIECSLHNQVLIGPSGQIPSSAFSRF
jgi:hypothetical protein